MTPEEIEAFFTVHRTLPREGPGEAADVHWAIAQLGLSGPVDVLDAGCGPGADLVTLAQALPGATIAGVEKTPHFAQEASARVAGFGPRVSVYEGDMAVLSGAYDLIWCTGALYFLGVTEGLKGWRAALKPGGAVAFSEPVILRPGAAAQPFWEEYAQITDLDGITARVAAAGYAVRAHRMIVGPPWEAYFTPMQARIDMLRAQSPDAVLTAALDEHQREIDRWRAAPDDIAYALLIAVAQ
jgi:SAM-dependent methyltransferase